MNGGRVDIATEKKPDTVQFFTTLSQYRTKDLLKTEIQ